MKQFEDFDSYKHDKYYLSVGSSTFEIWHKRGMNEDELNKIATNFIRQDQDCDREPKDFYRRDLRPY